MSSLCCKCAKLAQSSEWGFNPESSVSGTEGMHYFNREAFQFWRVIAGGCFVRKHLRRPLLCQEYIHPHNIYYGSGCVKVINSDASKTEAVIEGTVIYQCTVYRMEPDNEQICRRPLSLYTVGFRRQISTFGPSILVKSCPITSSEPFKPHLPIELCVYIFLTGCCYNQVCCTVQGLGYRCTV